MTYKLAIHPDALADIENAGTWYEQKQPGLGTEFSRAIRQAINDLPALP